MVFDAESFPFVHDESDFLIFSLLAICFCS